MDSKALREHIAQALQSAGVAGLSAQALAAGLSGVSRSSLNRRLAELVHEGVIGVHGAGRSTRYRSRVPLTQADIDAWFARPWQERPTAVFDESLLQAEPNIDEDCATRLTRIQALAHPVDRRFLTTFAVQFSWGSSVLEGGSYSALDTQALIQYGERHPDKPTEDALLVLNHKRALEHLWEQRELSVTNACRLHALLTDDHGLADQARSDHFLPAGQRGVLREYQEVNLGESAYIPPFRPATGFVADAFARMLDTAQRLSPARAALYLMTRIPYLQAFANGNKRTARLLANAPLLSAGLLPLSFADVNKAEYIRAMAAFYELRTTLPMEGVFIRSYARSVVRGSNLPLALRGSGFDTEVVAAQLADYVRTGRLSAERRVRVFVEGA